jgi:hypothetical protein
LLPTVPEAGDQVFNTGAFEDIPDPNVLWFECEVPLFQKAHVLKAWFLAGGAILGGGGNYRSRF